MFVMGSSGNSCLLYSTACFLFLFKRDFLFVLGTMMSDFFFPPEKEKGEERRKPQTETHGMQPSALLPIPPGWAVSKSHDYHHWDLTHYHSTVSSVHWISCQFSKLTVWMQNGTFQRSGRELPSKQHLVSEDPVTPIPQPRVPSHICFFSGGCQPSSTHGSGYAPASPVLATAIVKGVGSHDQHGAFMIDQSLQIQLVYM